MRRFLAIAYLLFLMASGLSAQQVDFLAKIRRHRSPEKRVLVDKVGTLTFDDTAHRLIFKDDDGDHLDVGYDDIGKIIFEVTTHMRAGAFSQAIQMATLAGAVAGTIVARGHVNNYWFYLEYKDHNSNKTALLDVPKNVSDEVIDKAGNLFGSRVTVTNFVEIGVPVKSGRPQGIRLQAANEGRQENPSHA